MVWPPETSWGGQSSQIWITNRPNTAKACCWSQRNLLTQKYIYINAARHPSVSQPFYLNLHMCMRKECIWEQSTIKVNNVSQPPAVIKPLVSIFLCKEGPVSHLETRWTSWHLRDACKHTAIPWLSPASHISRYRNFFDNFLVHTGLRNSVFIFYTSKGGVSVLLRNFNTLYGADLSKDKRVIHRYVF